MRVCACRGCALLVGVGGSGKQTLAKFAAFVADCDLHTVSMSAGYNLARFREELKHVFKVGRLVWVFVGVSRGQEESINRITRRQQQALTL